MNLLRYFPFIVALILLSFTARSESRKILINEFMASNSASLADEDGDFSDWIELFNPGEETLSLNGWFLTDKADNLIKWKIPDVSLSPGQYLVIFASEKKRDKPASELHTNFKLSASGEFLALVEPDGSSISHSFGDVFPVQQQDISYGLYQGQNVFFDQPTPGSANTLGNLVQEVQFSVNRGFYDAAFDVALSDVGDVSIYYTTDGTRPTTGNGTLYIAPVHISTTTPLSAIAVNASGVASPVVSHTYFFISDIVQQSNTPAGYPSTWSKFKFSAGYAPADYEMDPQVCNSSEYKELMNDALTSIPTLSVVTNIGYLFSHEKDGETGGIYIFTGNSGDGGAGSDWERPVSVEYYDPSTGEEFQVNCGLRLHGGNSRVPENSPKHSFRISFRSMYGPSKLNFNFFNEPGAATEFNSLVLRAGYNYSWTKNLMVEQRSNAQYILDPFAKTTQRALGQVSAHEKFVHLYLNGLYWGVYNVSEKLTNDLMESYFGGNEDDWDVIKDHGGTVDGLWTAWSHLYQQTKAGIAGNTGFQKVQGRNPDGAVNTAYENLLDVEQLVDYMQYNMYIGNEDWDHNNWIGARNRVSNDAGFRFFCWDAETSLTRLDYNNVDENNEENPSWFYHELQGNDDFRMLFADHIQKNFFNGGALTPDAAIDRYSTLANEIDLAIIAESARWGDYRKDVSPSDNVRVVYTRNDYWLPRKNELLNNYFPYRTDVVVQQFREIGLFPNIEAPVFSHMGGELQSAIDLEMTSNYGEIYYTTDGSDPREAISSSIAGSAGLYTSALPVNTSLTVKARAKSGGEWSPVTEAVFDVLTGAGWLAEQNSFEAGAYPNPFKSSATLFYTLAKNEDVDVDIYSVDGRWIEKVFSGFQFEGYNEIKWTPDQSLSGIFIYRIRVNDQLFTGKLVRRN